MSDALNIPLAFVVFAAVMLLLLFVFSRSSDATVVGDYLSRILAVIKGIVDSALSFFEGIFHVVLWLGWDHAL